MCIVDIRDIHVMIFTKPIAHPCQCYYWNTNNLIQEKFDYAFNFLDINLGNKKHRREILLMCIKFL